MSEPTYIVTMNFNRVELDSWIDQRKRPDGDYDLIGMGRRREYDAGTGALIAHKVEPTGLTGLAPRSVIECYKPAPWWARLFGAAYDANERKPPAAPA